MEEITEPEADDPYGEWREEQRNTTEVRPDVLDFLDNKWLPLTSESKIPNQLSAAQWAIEGGRNTEIDNPAGLKRGGEVLDYGDLADNAEAYTDTVIDIAATNMGIPLEEFNIEDYDVEEILYHLQFQSNGEWGIKRYEDSLKDKDGNYDPQLYIDMVHDMPEWRYYSSL